MPLTICCSSSKCNSFEPLYPEICEKLSLNTIKIQSRWTTCSRCRPTLRGNQEQRHPDLRQLSIRIATLRPRTTKTKSLPSRTGGTTDSRTDQRGRTRGHLSAAIILTPVPEATLTGTANTISTARSRIVPKKSAGKESERLNRLQISKDGAYWTKVYVTSNGNSEQQETGAGASFTLKSLMTPLIQAPRVIPQLILSLCTILIATCYKLFEIMTPFNGDKISPRLAVRAGNKTFSWLFDT